MGNVSQSLQLSHLLILMLFKTLKTSTNLRLQILKMKVFMSPRLQAIRHSRDPFKQPQKASDCVSQRLFHGASANTGRSFGHSLCISCSAISLWFSITMNSSCTVIAGTPLRLSWCAKWKTKLASNHW